MNDLPIVHGLARDAFWLMVLAQLPLDTIWATASPPFACHAKVTVLFIQFEDESTWGDYESKKDVMAHRVKNMAALTHIIEAYDFGGQTAFEAALNAPELERIANYLKAEAEFRKTTVIELARRRLAAGQKRQASGIF